MSMKMKYENLTHSIIGCAFEVHNQLGNGFQEVIYQRCLAYELDLNKIKYAREVDIEIRYKGLVMGSRRVDFLIDDTIAVEIKAQKELTEVHLAQSLNYLEAYHLEIGLLLNFGAKSLEYKRIHNNKLFEP